MTRVVLFIGTRPEAIKMAPVIAALRADPAFELRVVSTGQHKEMLQQVVDIFEIEVDRELDVMRTNQTLAGLTSRLMTGIDELLVNEQPQLVLAQGDTTTVLCASLGSFYRRIPFGHVEAGLRTGNLEAPFPEEANRVLTGRLTQLHLAPTARAQENLLAEGVAPESIWVTGNTVIDALHMEVARQERADVRAAIDDRLAALVAPDWRDVRFVLVTGHRRENFGDGFKQICESLRMLATEFADTRFIYPVHLNPNVKGPVYSTLGELQNVFLVEPQPYDRFVALMSASHLVLTDSGGVQEEAPGLAKPVLVMRETTERPEGVDAGTVRLVGADAARIVPAVRNLLQNEDEYRAMAQARNPYGDGTAAQQIKAAIRGWFQL